MLYLTGDNVPKEQVLKLAKKCKLPVWPSEDNPFLYQGDFDHIPPHLVVLAGELTETRLQTLFQLPITALLDSNATMKSLIDFLSQTKEDEYFAGLGFLLTGPVIYHFDVALIFTKALQDRRKFSNYRFESIHLALHESLVNGLFHGNLNLSSTLRQNFDAYQAYTKLVNKRLNSPSFARKGISIISRWNNTKMKITIRDEGMGYSLSEILRQPPSAQSKSGRGLRIIASAADSCTIENYGKEITLSFIREKPECPDMVSPVDVVSQTTTAPKEDLSRAKVLIIEDNQSNQALLAGLLTQIGIKQIDVASDGIQGLNKVLTFEPDLIILDIKMPNMDGYDVLHRLKSVERTRSIPILIQTGSDTREARDKTFRAGASDFITKPLNPLEFFARVRIHLENRLLVNRLQNRLKQIHHELMTAQNMQMALLPCPATLQDIQKRYALEVTSYFEPSDKLGGDFWQTVPLSNNRIGFYLCDFSGHGLAAALNTFRLHTLIFQMQAHIQDPSDFLNELNQQLYILLQRGQFATFFFGIYDPKKQTLTYSGAASPSPFYWDGNEWQILQTRGLPLGISQQAVYENITIPFESGNRLFIYSDALTETINSKGDQTNVNELFKVVQDETANQPIREGLKGIIARFFEFAPPPPQDDLTAVLIEAHPYHK